MIFVYVCESVQKIKMNWWYLAKLESWSNGTVRYRTISNIWKNVDRTNLLFWLISLKNIYYIFLTPKCSIMRTWQKDPLFKFTFWCQLWKFRDCSFLQRILRINESKIAETENKIKIFWRNLKVLKKAKIIEH